MKYENRQQTESRQDSIPTLKGVSLLKRCRHKDIYDFGDQLLVVANDNILNPYSNKMEHVSGKGMMATRLSSFWFQKLSGICPNHYITDDIGNFLEGYSIDSTKLAGRSVVVRKMLPLPITCKVQGYLTGPAWEEYSQTGTIAGVKLPSGLSESKRLPSPVFFPIFKESTLADSGIDELKNFCGKHLSNQIRDIALNLYFNAWKIASQQKVLLTATVFRFGLYREEIHLIGECITPDSSVFTKPASLQNKYSLSKAGENILFPAPKDSDTGENLKTLSTSLTKGPLV